MISEHIGAYKMTATEANGKLVHTHTHTHTI